MKMTTTDYNNMVKGFDRLNPIILKHYHEVKDYYKAVYDNACKTAIKSVKTKYIFDLFYNAHIHFSKWEVENPTCYTVITDNRYNDSHIETSINVYLKSKGYDFYNH